MRLNTHSLILFLTNSKSKKKVVSVGKPLNTYSGTTAQKIKKARTQKQKGTLTTVTPDNLWTLTN